MRLSMKQRHRRTLSSILHNYVTIKLNGIVQKNATVADENLGMVERYTKDFNMTETVYGEVVIELNKNAPLRARKVWELIRNQEAKT